MNFVPFSIGKYDFIDLLGRGGMAEVYRVRVRGELGFEKEFAFKRVLPGFMTQPHVIALFENEARLTSLLNHPNIVHVFDFVKAGDSHFLVMELVNGKNLSDALEKCRDKGESVPPPIAAAILLEVSRGLEYAHNRTDSSGRPLNIIHRDVSPHNIMVSSEGAIKIVDFGIAKARLHEQRTRTGMAWGKVGYMSPEQALGDPLDRRSDIFSACALFYEMITGHKVVSGENELAILSRIQKFKFSDIEGSLERFPPDIVSILKQGLASEVGARLQSASQLGDLLQHYLKANAETVAPSDIATWLENLFRKNPQSQRFEEMVPFSEYEAKLLREGFPMLEDMLNRERTSTRSTAPPPSFGKRKEVWIASALMGILFIWYFFPLPNQRERTYTSLQETPPVESIPTLVPSSPIPSPSPSVDPLATMPPSPIPPPTPAISPPPATVMPTPTITPPSSQGAKHNKKNRELRPPTKQPMKNKVKAKESVSLIPSAPPKKMPALPITRSTASSVPSPQPTDNYESLQRRAESESGATPSQLAKTLYEQGLSFYAQGNFRMSLDYFRRSRLVWPKNVLAWIYEARSLNKLSRHPEAVRLIHELLEIRPELIDSPIVTPFLEGEENP